MDEPKQSIWKKEISFKRKPKAERAQPPKPTSEPKPSVWKKEISFKRKPKAERVQEPVSETAVAEPQRETPASPPADPARADLEWLTAGLDALEAAEASPAPAPPEPETEPQPVAVDEKPKTSRLKKEISFKRKPKEAKQPKTAKLPKERKPKAEKPAKPKRERKPKAERAPKPKTPKPEKRRDPTGPSRKLPKRLVGLKVGASQLAAAKVVNNGHAQVEQVVREDLEPGIVVAGELREPEALATALRAFFKKHKLPKRGVRLGIANNRIGVRIFEITGIEDPKQLANAIRFRRRRSRFPSRRLCSTTRSSARRGTRTVS